MMQLMQYLEPRQEERGVELIKELDEFTEVFFFYRGTYEIGFEINHQPYFVLRYKNNNVIGAYGLTFNVRALFLYKTVSKCEGFSIRKSNWLDILNSNDKIMAVIKSSVKKDYELQVKQKVMLAKKQIIKKW